MKLLKFTIFIFLITSCETRTIKYSGLNDLFIGVHQVVLYENGEFYLELGAGGNEGIYTISNDTVYLKYDSKPKNLPDKLLMAEEYFETICNEQYFKTIKIKR